MPNSEMNKSNDFSIPWLVRFEVLRVKTVYNLIKTFIHRTVASAQYYLILYQLCKI